jgi:hypothetical protein
MQHLLEGFGPIGLAEMDTVALTNRIDTKFVFHQSLLPVLLQELQQSYRILTIDDCREHAYDTLYFDDQHFGMYLAHHNQRGSRYKLRLRRYGSSSINYMEMKRKTNTGRTVKSRKKTTAFGETLTAEQLQFFRDVTGQQEQEWKFATRITFQRITLVSLDPPERMTLDLNLTFANEHTSKSFGNLIVAEVKQGSKAPSAFIKLIKSHHIAPFSISKYCLGLSLLRPELKHNLFKRQQLTIHQIQSRA